MFDILDNLLGLGGTSIAGLVNKALPQDWKLRVKARIDEWPPFRTIATNHDLIRAVRLAWVKTSLLIIATARENPSPELSWHTARAKTFYDKAETSLREIRAQAFRRNISIVEGPIDRHAKSLLAGTPEFAIDGATTGIGDAVTSQFATVLAEIANVGIDEIPEDVKRLARSGIATSGGAPRSFGELVFADFAEILKNPEQYPEARVAFQLYTAGQASKAAADAEEFYKSMAVATRELGQSLVEEFAEAKAGNRDLLQGIDGLAILGAEMQRRWLEEFERVHQGLDNLGQGVGRLEASMDQVLQLVTPDIAGETARRDAAWTQFKQAYLRHCDRIWDEKFPSGSLSDYGADIDEQLGNPRLFELAAGPLVDDQEYRLVVNAPEGRGQLEILRKAQPTTGDGRPGVVYVGFDTLVQALRGEHSDAISLAPAYPAIPGQSAGLRLALVSSSGLGKSTTLTRLQREINRSGQGFAIKLNFTDFRDTSDNTEDNLNKVLTQFLINLGLKIESDGGSAAELEMLRYGAGRELATGRLVILIDGLDHISETPRAITRLQHGEIWQSAHVVVSGRPQAFEAWNVDESIGESADLRRWRICSPMPLAEKQVKAYLGGFVDKTTGEREFRYDLVSRSLGELLALPRVLAHMRSIGRDELKEARTAAEIYYLAIHNLVEKGLVNERKEGRTDQVKRLMSVLAALAFQSLFEGSCGIHPDGRAAYPLDEDNLSILRTRVSNLYGSHATSGANLADDLATLARLSALVGNGLLDSGGLRPDSLTIVDWSNPTVQAFLAAYWLSTGARDAPAQPDEPIDTEWFRQALYYAHAPDNDRTEEINLFLSEMPARATSASSWVAAASAWYDPALVRGAGRPGLWATEMIARSWRRMHALANRSVNDWWDISYDALTNGDFAGRAMRGPHPVPPASRSAASQGAKRALDGFLNDFQSMLEERSLDPGVLVPSGWAYIPGGLLQMGSPETRHGFPPKTHAFWLQQLELCASGTPVSELAHKLSPAAWWTGQQGMRQRNEELTWLTEEVFGPYARASTSGADVDAAKQEALLKLRNYFRRPDEKAEESEQSILAFTLSATPLSNASFALFSPGHTRSIAGVVAEAQRDVLNETSQNRELAFGWNQPERPVIYTSWFDAWAFAQWANWKEDGKHYGCRLPHEPEWEFACKAKLIDGQIVATPFNQRYWWGDTFYADDHIPVEEHIFTDDAHAVGWPGATRDATTAAPNGFGLKDMIGNVWEWSANVYDQHTETELKRAERVLGYSRYRPEGRDSSAPDSAQPQPPHPSASRTMRGGIWYYMNHISTAASRFRGEPNDTDYKIGFRLVREVIEPS